MTIHLPIFLVILLSCLNVFGFYYPKSYVESRETFFTTTEKIKKIAPQMRRYKVQLPTKTKMELSLDGVFIPAQNPDSDRLLIITGGIHGVEGYTGSAIQQAYFYHILKNEELPDHAVFVVHSVNPYGFHFDRRVDEDNVDLNRNMGADQDEFGIQIEGFENFDSFLNPTSPLKVSFFSDLKLFIQTLYKMAIHSKKKLRQFAVSGQYQKPKGIYFGGNKPQPNTQGISQLFLGVSAPFNKILHIDIHTGYGNRGQLHFITTNQVTKLRGFNQFFADYPIDRTEDDDFYITHGSFEKLTLKLFKDKEFFIPMTFEFGTMDSHSLKGGFYSLRNLIYENQGFQYGYVDSESQQKITRDFLNMFNPEDPQWRKQVVDRGLEVLLDLSNKLEEI